MMDIIYFDDDSSLEGEFIKDIKEKFPEVVLRDAYDQFKGYRQEVHFEEEEISKDEYYCWLIGNGWIESSLNLQLMTMSEDKKEEFKRIFELTREKYPEAFKK